jgi:hypothetical protein
MPVSIETVIFLTYLDICLLCGLVNGTICVPIVKTVTVEPFAGAYCWNMAKTGLARFWQNNSLTIVTLALFLLFLFGQSVAGQRNYNDEQQEHGQPEVTYVEYLANPEFIEATFENWESEFLAVASLVVLSIFLRQKGSPESKSVGDPHSKTG